MRLGNIITVNPESIRNGYPFDEIEYIDISSVGTGILQGTQRLQIGGAPSRAKRIIRNGDTLLATVRPNLRSFWFARNPQENAIASTGFAVLRAGKEIDERFLYFTVTNQPFTDYLTANAKGAAYPAVDTDTIERADIFLPPLPTQRKIASILSAYDDLIENNLRRIRILEEMAQNLYREWFVKFRFPGHQQARFTDSSLGRIPDGWEVKRFGEVALNFDRLRKPLSSMQRAERKGIYPYYGAAKIFDYIDAYIFDGIYLLLAEDGSVVTTDRKPVLQYVSGKFWPNNHTHILQGKGLVSTEFLFMVLSEINITGYITGAAQPKITQENLNRIPVVVAEDSILQAFNEFIRDVFREKIILGEKNATLRRTRDLLLPKLISGEVDVSDLDIAIPGVAV